MGVEYYEVFVFQEGDAQGELKYTTHDLEDAVKWVQEEYPYYRYYIDFRITV